MNRWHDIRRLASLIEDESEGRRVEHGQALALARQLAREHPHMGASMTLIVQRMEAAARRDEA